MIKINQISRLKAWCVYFQDEKFIFIDNDELIWARKEIDEIGVESPVALFPFSISSSRTFPEEKILEWVKDSDENYLIFGSRWGSN